MKWLIFDLSPTNTLHAKCVSYDISLWNYRKTHTKKQEKPEKDLVSNISNIFSFSIRFFHTPIS